VCANNNGQGTMGLTPGQKVYALQVFDQLGSGSTSSIVAALNWLARYGRAKGIRVANMSLGGPKSWAVCAALDAVVRQGITMVVAAGAAWGLVVVGGQEHMGQGAHLRWSEKALFRVSLVPQAVRCMMLARCCGDMRPTPAPQP
jgi:subtilisin family serine protease